MKAFESVKFIGTGLLATVLLSACSQGRTQMQANPDPSDLASGIINGREVEATNPMAHSFVALYDTKLGALCTGTLIGNNLVLTAAHCIAKDPSMMAVIFQTDLNNGAVNKEMVRRVDGATVNANYAQHSRDPKNTGDIALVHFQGTTPSGYVGVPILPRDRAGVLRGGQLMLLAGYGITNGVSKVGSGVLRYTSVRISDAAFSQTEVELDQTHGTGACHGDSGGPAILFIGSQAYVWGVTSRGDRDPNNDCTHYAIYTNASIYTDWISNAAQALIARTSNANRLASPQFIMTLQRPMKL